MARLIPQVSCLGILACLGAATACDRAHAPPLDPAVTIRDSADVELVENHAPEWDEGDSWNIAAEPEVVIGGYRGVDESTDSSHLVWSVADVAPLSDGRVAVLSSKEKKLFLFEPSGEFAGSIGREGRGPGEFGYPEHLQILPGDTLVVWDFMFGPIAYFDPSGQLLRNWRIDVGALFAAVRKPNRGSPERVHLPLSDGSFLVRRSLVPGEPVPLGVLHREPIEFLRIDSAYNAHALGRWEGRENIYLEASPIRSVPFPFEVHLAAGDKPLSLYISNSDQYEIHQFAGTGALSRIVRRTPDPIPIAASDIEEWKEDFERRNWEANWEPWDQAMAELPPPESRPPIVGLLVDSEGYLWVADRRDRNGSEWSVFDPTGRWLGTLEIPLWRPEWIGEDLILGINEDPDIGVQVIEGYRLDRRGGPDSGPQAGS